MHQISNTHESLRHCEMSSQADSVASREREEVTAQLLGSFRVTPTLGLECVGVFENCTVQVEVFEREADMTVPAGMMWSL